MPAVFVHGVPETVAVWDPLIDALKRNDTVALSLPGFGNPLPSGFEPTKERYARWLADELARFDDVDLVAHDWGALASVKVLAEQPENVSTWVLDIADLDEDHRWHDTARTWQTPGDGEALMETMLALSDDERAGVLHGLGMPRPGADVMAAAMDETMATAILALYRSAVTVGAEWGPGIDDWTGRGLVVGAHQDRFRSPGLAERLAARTGAQLVELPDAGHWWMLDSTDAVAATLQEFWSRA